MGPRLLLSTVLLLAIGRNPIESTLSKELEQASQYIPNTILFAILKGGNFSTELPTYFAACSNGVLCEAEDPEVEAAILKNVFNGAVTDEQRNAMAKESETRTCTPTEPTNPNVYEKCNCVDKKTPPFCTAVMTKDQYLKTATKKDCPAVALKKLKETGWKELGKSYDLSVLKQGKDNGELEKMLNEESSAIDGITHAEAESAGKFLCDALNPVVEKAVENLMASDYSYMTADAVVSAILFGEVSVHEKKAMCQEPWLKEHEMGKCLCSFTRGTMFCFYKLIALFFQEAGYLTCPTPPAPAAQGAPAAQAAPAKYFDTSKKPTAVKAGLFPKKGGTAGGGGATATALFSTLSLTLLALLGAH